MIEIWRRLEIEWFKTHLRSLYLDIWKIITALTAIPLIKKRVIKVYTKIVKIL